MVGVNGYGALRTQEFQRYDGWYNNLANRDWGSAGSRLHRDSPSNYEDGVYMMNLSLPSARVLSELVFKGQVVAYEIVGSTQTSCPLEIMKIPVPPGDPVYDIDGTGTEIPFTRAKYDKESGQGFNSPREQVNERTAWIDGSFVYSVMEAWVATMRSFQNGTLREGTQKRIQKQNPTWTDEELFQAARRWLIATLQKIIFYDFLPALINEDVKPYTKYMPHVPPGISHAFAAAAFRFPHSIVPPAMILRKNVDGCEFRDEVGGFPALRLCQNWWNAQDIVQEYTVDEIILGMASQVSEADDIVVVEDLRDFIFGPMHFTRLDVVASSIMRGRDNGLPSYNALRKTYNLPAKEWETINPKLYQTNKTMFDKLAKLYGSIDYLDAYVGGMLEVDNGPGDLFKAIIKDQFERLRDSDRFWFENKQNGLFTDEEIKQIHKITLRDIIRDTTAISDQWLQKDVFFFKDGDPCPQPFQVNVTAFEWLQECYVRQVIVEFSPGTLTVRKPRGPILRKMIFPESAHITVYHSEPNASTVHGPYCLIKLKKTYDLVLRLPSDKHLPEFLAALTLSLKKLDGQVTSIPLENAALLDQAETKDRRQQRLDHFFREAYARAFNQPRLSDTEAKEDDTDDILHQTITRYELAQAMGMRETDIFVQRMFAVTTHSDGDVITFAEFLEVLRKFSEGSVKDKYKLLFAMCDVNGTGRVRRSEFAEFVRSLNAVVGVSITESSQNHVIENILCRSGINPGSEYLTAADFEAIFAQIDGRRPIGVDFRGAKIKVNLQETASLSSFAVSTLSEHQCLPRNVLGSIAAFIETYRQHIAILFIFCCINMIVFLERFWREFP
ncbi:heme peroxidase [Teladorsagia circumcincta]|uniref:NAD(P)H oxidase (H2O2-forming) n=1 Tax=Teladorsagia circumcincta TaxID=45464 RepID=A0A2G9UU06_TELCI|nr:heme peroxidase [Teladorsagia circumcincta]